MLDSVFEPEQPAPTTLEVHATELDLRSLAVVADERAECQLALRELWLGLASGSLEILNHFVTQQRCYLVVRQGEARSRTAVQTRGIALLQRVYKVGCQKVAAYDLNMSPSNAAELGRQGLLAMGLRCRIQETPFILVAAANAGSATDGMARSSALCRDQPSLQVLSIARPDEPLARVLPPAVCAVTRALVAGQTRSLIARVRARSERTVANQLASAFKQLSAFSRLDLLRLLAEPLSGVAKAGGIELKAPTPTPNLHAGPRHLASHGADVAAVLP